MLVVLWAGSLTPVALSTLKGDSWYRGSFLETARQYSRRRVGKQENEGDDVVVAPALLTR
jgi:hypothetical protein